MNWAMWSEIEAVLMERDLKPILAVIPDNQDPKLRLEPAVEDFWERVRRWQARGWTIALHGYQHRYVTCHAGIVTLRKKSEFAGLPAAEQEAKLRRGVEILAREGIKPRIWIAPSNSFDAATLALLPKFGITMISDGHFRLPFLDRQDMFWIPQQLFGFRPAPRGVWTVCYHHNQWTPADRRQFREDLDEYGSEILCLDDVVQVWGRRRSAWSAFLCTSPRLSPLVTRCQLKAWSWRESRTRRSKPATKPIPSIQTR
jgi:predicted deacetylase